MCGALSASREAFEMSERSSRKRPAQKSNDKPREVSKKESFKSTGYDAVDAQLKNAQSIIIYSSLF
ncbi:hypothetical protein [Acinetobacter baumannii]|uniref:Uncharacterized protein n=1 Tax=Acinetobacter baumannii TaxID=470 RepID=A0A8B5UHW1_ACIBA|nr:hypothetical protein [Acinetobacter baumannii]CAH1073603.1 Uncharacterised protein [Acinetobacter phage MD-2021a]ARG33981.1 hypothetical protein B7L46_03155 [Acinetobacter baumannii]EKU7213372.1 hypothetical protein [Acinetobacter baumannii]EKW1054867.1 hypothetical protein [Acinetobacter baumannii]EKW6912451.1 hypothetical protein [Acinetobacter baumannii]